MKKATFAGLFAILAITACATGPSQYVDYRLVEKQSVLSPTEKDKLI